MQHHDGERPNGHSAADPRCREEVHSRTWHQPVNSRRLCHSGAGQYQLGSDALQASAQGWCDLFATGSAKVCAGALGSAPSAPPASIVTWAHWRVPEINEGLELRLLAFEAELMEEMKIRGPASVARRCLNQAKVIHMQEQIIDRASRRISELEVALAATSVERARGRRARPLWWPLWCLLRRRH